MLLIQPRREISLAAYWEIHVSMCPYGCKDKHRNIKCMRKVPEAYNYYLRDHARQEREHGAGAGVDEKA